MVEEGAGIEEQIEEIWWEILVQFGCCACACHERSLPGRDAIRALREVFETTIEAAVRKHGVQIWDEQESDYVLGRVCKIAELAVDLAQLEPVPPEELGAAHVQQAAEQVIRHARRVIDRLEQRGGAADRDDTDWGVAFGRFCEDY